MPRSVKLLKGKTLGRSAFLRAVQKHAPEVLTGLRKVLPIFSTIPQSVFEQTSRGPAFVRPANQVDWLLFGAEPEPDFVMLPDLLYWRNIAFLASTDSRVSQLRNALTEWANKVHLTDDWLLDRALQTLYHWREHPADVSNFWEGLPSAQKFILSERERRFEYEHEGWGLEFEPWEEFVKRLHADLQDALVKYQDRTQRLALDRGWSVQRKGRYRDEHFQWLVLFHVKEQSPSAIAGHSRIEESTVMKAVARLTRAIGLTPRNSRKGKGERPRGRGRRKT